MSVLSAELERKMRQYKRVLLSYADFKHAKLASSYVLEQRLHEKCRQESCVILEAMNCSMIVAYCRPFSGNDRSAPDLSERLLKILTSAEREMHKTVMWDRNKVLAHSDLDALNLEPVRWQVAEQEMILPIKNWGLAPLTEEATALFNSMAGKLLVATMEERTRIEPELIPHLRLADSENPFV